MLSIGKLGAGQADYYLEAVGQGVEDYYAGAGEAPGSWAGSAAGELEVFGRVEGELLHRALSGQHPRTGDPLVKLPGGGGVRVPGFDLTFSAPKSVSVFFGLGDAGLSREVREAHEAAVAGALGYMERQGAVARRGHGGTESVLGNGWHRDFKTTLIYADYAPSAHERELVERAFGRSINRGINLSETDLNSGAANPDEHGKQDSAATP